AEPKGAARARVVLCVHGGGFVGGSIYTHRKLFGHLAKRAGIRALLFDYSLVPKAFPTQLEETVAAYRWLLDQGIEHIAFAGDSAGGGLIISAQLRARELGLPMPAAALPFSPWLDMELSGETYETNRDVDVFADREMVRGLVELYLGEGDRRDPLANALYGELTGIAPLYVQVGGEEVLLDDARRLVERASAAGVEARLDVFPGMQHTFQMAAGRAPEADDAIGRMAAWVRPLLGL
ncbi:MAG: alpha/beta hydrolase, partial [Nonomuraea sp.]|nr:alpha/beta hydrolase [Nonomuraea sp.]